MISGTIYLYDRGGYLVAEKRYITPQIRKQIIDMWQKQYAVGYERCYLQYAPDADETKVDEDGTNIHPIGKISPLNKWGDERRKKASDYLKRQYKKKLAKEDLGRT